MEQTIRGTFAALNATNEAILYAKSPEELYAKICEAAFSSGDFLATAVFLLDADTSRLRLAVGFGEDVARLRGIDISIIANTPEGSGVCGQAFRDQQACISNDYLNDPRSLAWRAGARTGEVAAAAAMPLICNGRSVGVFLVTRREVGSLGDELVSLLARMAANVSFALDNFEHERTRKSSERAMRRLNQMFGAISATNEAILRAKTEHDLYQRVCDAAVHSGKSVAAVVLLAEPDTHWLEPVAGTGDAIELITQTRFSTDPDNIYGKGVCGQAFRTQRPCINNDIPKSDGPWRQVGRDVGVMACIAVPLTKFGKSIGVLLFFVGRSWAADEEIVALMARIAENVSVALDNFERADEKARADRQKDRLSRMFAALSATNEAIMRARSREEMFALVCQAAGMGARFNSTSIFLVTPGSDYLEMAATGGPTSENARKLKVSINEAVPEGRGLCGTAFRSRQASINNNFLKDVAGNAFRDIIEREGARSGAAFPLFVDGEPAGVMLFISSERDTFTAEFAELLQRLADNVSFALGSFERADEKARTEDQKERLTRMFAALSATNEAIMRAKSRTELFHLVCEAAVVGGNFTSTAIALERPGDDYLENVASAGPDRERAFNVRLSINAAHPEGRSLTGIAFRTRKPCISNDYLGDFGASSPFYQVLRDAGTRSGAAFPLLKHGKPIGAIIFLSSEIGAFSPELIGLLRRLAENVSFALENFDRADEKARADERIEYLASHDGLTRLPNRETFNELLRHAIEVASRHQRQFALLFIDLDRFKVINDSLGHDAGDLLLVKIADRLRGTLRSSDVIARLGGDEFVVILEETERADVETIAESLLSALSQPLQLSGHECHTTASIGIAMYPADGSDAKTLTKNADMAMYLAKEDGKNGFRFHSKEIKAQSIERLTLENALRRALERDQFSLHYQPKIDIASGQITGVEALLRWTHPDLGQIAPAQFIPLAEEIGLIVPIGRWVLNEACAQNIAWQRRGLRPVTMAVNLSPRQFADEHLLQDVDEALRSSGMSPALLQLEVTESVVMRNVPRAVRVLDAIQSRGIRLAIDDFGTGYSSMSLMKQFPIDTIKIDRSFVRDLARDSEDQAIAQAIISMGKALGMTVIAEGVETTEQERFLRDHGCDEMQGYLLSKPLPPRELAELLCAAPALASPPLQPVDHAADDQAASDLGRKRAVI
ncbi:EAL domain-containing protein [Bradyrhizobium sp. BRP22]|uniref:bifunctional diguanylate cyclase/phosphodiesterase n=1 Tax=Bradyrhizobium sp. BRP22 TaxID=2793821 RepID=UPI001CD69F3B|nr:EAL domain-containing protein [Bradyrhizobium sp. BRP22]MCA1457424.1 EAL domain-containing protein [Bradyrhizobium sp. BRP22]